MSQLDNLWENPEKAFAETSAEFEYNHPWQEMVESGDDPWEDVDHLKWLDRETLEYTLPYSDIHEDDPGFFPSYPRYDDEWYDDEWYDDEWYDDEWYEDDRLRRDLIDEWYDHCRLQDEEEERRLEDEEDEYYLDIERKLSRKSRAHRFLGKVYGIRSGEWPRWRWDWKNPDRSWKQYRKHQWWRTDENRRRRPRVGTSAALYAAQLLTIECYASAIAEEIVDECLEYTFMRYKPNEADRLFQFAWEMTVGRVVPKF